MGFPEQAGHCVSLVGPDDEPVFDLFFNGVDTAQTFAGLFQHSAAAAFLAFRQQDHCASFTAGQHGVVHGLLHLVYVDVLRVPAAGNDDHVCLLGNLYPVDLVHELAGFFMGSDVIPGEHPQETVFRIQNGVEQENAAAPFLHGVGPQGHPFHLVVVDRVSFHGP